MTGFEKLRHISVKELALLGMTDVAYIKSVKGENGTVYEIHAADGTPVAVMEEREVAFATVRQHDLEPLSVH
ncbi:MAG: DUF1150 family protein [Rhodospirillales bacterium]|nr:DUF1150 family protein [Rhodospirillales bacterium]